MFHEDAADAGGAGEGDCFDFGVRADFLSDFGDRVEAGYYLDYAGWDASFEGEDGLGEGGEGGLAGGFPDGCAACGL